MRQAEAESLVQCFRQRGAQHRSVPVGAANGWLRKRGGIMRLCQPGSLSKKMGKLSWESLRKNEIVARVNYSAGPMSLIPLLEDKSSISIGSPTP